MINAESGRTNEFAYFERELFDGVFIWIAKVHRHGVVTVHQGNETVHEVADVLERTRLFAMPVDLDAREKECWPDSRMAPYCHGFVLQCLQDEITDHTAVVHVHARAVSVEDARDANIDLLLARRNNEIGVAARRDLTCSAYA